MRERFYRPEIDGLRAIAILSVLFYHAGFKIFGGGFVGVDVFFVISGFLIASLLMMQLDQNRFDVFGFWQRRIGRILPALAVMTLTVLIIGSAVYFPEDYKSVAKQAAFQSILASNFYFFKDTGYFNGDHATKPFLHIWSLGVEIQFYILIPFILAYVWKKKRDYLVPAIAGLVILSFAASVYAVTHYPEAAFYLLPFRMWELLTGSLIAALPASRIEKRQADALGTTGLLLIFASVVFYTKDMVFPGTAALLPCTGAALFIWSNGNGRNIAGEILAHKIPVFIGIISYSLYLWHWPIFSMSQYMPILPDGTIFKLFLISCSFTVAALSWKYIEQPFNRVLRHASKQYAYGIMATILVLFGVSGSVAFLHAKFQPKQNGFLDVAGMEHDISPYRKACQLEDEKRFIKDDVCQTNQASGVRPNFIMLGDSHGDADAPLFYGLSKQMNDNGYIAFKHGCPPVIGFSKGNWSKDDNAACHHFVEAAIDYIGKKHIKTAFLVAQWDIWLKDDTAIYTEPSIKAGYKTAAFNGLQETVDRLKQKNVRIYILLAPPEMPFPAPRMLGFQEKFHLGHEAAYIPQADYLKGRPKEMVDFMARNTDVSFLDPEFLFCQDGKCPAFENGHALYYDTHHPSSYGVEKLATLFAPAFGKEEVIRRRVLPLLTFVLSRPPSENDQKL